MDWLPSVRGQAAFRLWTGRCVLGRCRVQSLFFGEFPDLALHDMGQIFADFPDGPVPPSQFLQPGYGVRVETPADLPGRHAADDGVGRDIPGDDRPRRDHRAVADPHTGHDDRFVPDPYVVPDYDVAFVVPRRGDILPVQPPLLEKERERIVGQRSQRVVGTVDRNLAPHAIEQNLPITSRSPLTG